MTEYSDFLNSWKSHTKRLELCTPEDYLVKRDMEGNVRFRGRSELSLGILRISEKGVNLLKQVSLETAAILIHRNTDMHLLRQVFASKNLNHVEFYRVDSDNLRCFELAASIKQIRISVYETNLTKNHIYYKLDSLVYLNLTVHFSNQLGHQRKLFNSLQYLPNLSELDFSFAKLRRIYISLHCKMRVDLSNGLAIQPNLGFILPPMNRVVQISGLTKIFNNLLEITFFRNQLMKCIQWDEKAYCRCNRWKILQEGNYEYIKTCIRETY